MKITLVHISDIHIRTENDAVLANAHLIAAAAAPTARNSAHVFIVVTGDIAFSGKADEYAAARRFLEGIRDGLLKECQCPLQFVVVPGNHDCNFDLDTGTRRNNLRHILSSPTPEIDESVINSCLSVQKPFQDFRRTIETFSPKFDDGLWTTHIFDVAGKRIAFECINLSWTSQLDEMPGKLVFPYDRYQYMPQDDVDVRIAVLHEPFNWLAQTSYRPLRNLVRKVSDIVFTGHEHVGNVGIIDDASSGRSAFVEGCAMQEHSDGLRSSAFNVVVIDTQTSQFSVSRYSWTGSRYSASNDVSWTDYHELPQRQKNPLPLQKEFLRSLDDPGGPIRHPARAPLKLSDLFVYPDLIEVNDRIDQRLYKSSVFLTNAESLKGGVVLEGDEKSGRTSLLRHLVCEYYDRNFYPLLLNGSQLYRATEQSVAQALTSAIQEQYGPGHREEFMQLSRAKRIALIDDLDDSRVKSSAARADLIRLLKAQFDYILISIEQPIGLTPQRAAPDDPLLTFSRFRVQPFGYLLRNRLVAKWHSLGTDGALDEPTLLARRDASERIIDSVMKRTLIPSAPLYLLTILQSIDAGRSGEFKDSALGHYYQYLLTDAFVHCGVKADKLTEMFQYCAHLAWCFHSNNTTQLDESALRRFNDAFSREWTTVDLQPRLTLLVNASVLCVDGDGYRFHYPYIYYYLKGYYLSQHLDDLDSRAYVQHCCEHLYVRDHAHTILFLTHHTNDAFVLRAIEEALQRLFRGITPVTFKGDVGGVSKLITRIPKLRYEGGTPESHREERDRLRDTVEDDAQDGLTEKEENTDQLSIVAQLVALMKTIEILGQVLKNQYAKIPRRRKAELIHEAFSGPLRALRDFYTKLEADPDALLALVEASLERLRHTPSHEEREKLARRVVASTVLLVSFGFIARAAESANSDSLSEDVSHALTKSETIAFRLIDLAIVLDSPKPIPRAKIRKLLKDVGNELLPFRILQLFVLNRLYMFRTTEQDLQWLGTDLDLDLGTVHKIGYTQTSGRRITN